MDINLNYEIRRAIIGGLIAAVVSWGGAYALGQVSGYEARELLESSLPSFTTLCNTTILASATILALLLTALGVSNNSKQKIKSLFYQRIRKIAQFDIVLFVTSMVVLLLLNVPIAKTEEIPSSWFDNVYLATLIISSIIGGLLITVMLMLYSAVTDLIVIFGLDPDEHPMLEEQADEAEKELSESK